MNKKERVMLDVRVVSFALMVCLFIRISDVLFKISLIFVGVGSGELKFYSKGINFYKDDLVPLFIGIIFAFVLLVSCQYLLIHVKEKIKRIVDDVFLLSLTFSIYGFVKSLVIITKFGESMNEELSVRFSLGFYPPLYIFLLTSLLLLLPVLGKYKEKRKVSLREKRKGVTH